MVYIHLLVVNFMLQSIVALLQQKATYFEKIVKKVLTLYTAG